MQPKSKFFRRVMQSKPTPPKLLVRTHLHRWLYELEKSCQPKAWQKVGDHLTTLHKQTKQEEVKVFFDELTTFCKSLLIVRQAAEEIRQKWGQVR